MCLTYQEYANSLTNTLGALNHISYAERMFKSSVAKKAFWIKHFYMKKKADMADAKTTPSYFLGSTSIGI